MRPLRFFSVSVALFSCSLLLAIEVQAQSVLRPGETLVFPDADGGATACTPLVGTDLTELACSLPRYATTTAIAGARAVHARVQPPLAVGVAKPIYATASVFNDFRFEGSGEIVDAQVSVTYNYDADYAAAGLTKVHGDLGLTVRDITGNAANVAAVGSVTLVDEDLVNSQGFTDAPVQVSGTVYKGDSAHLVVKLRTGRTYRVEFGARTGSQITAAGVPHAEIGADWIDLRVTADDLSSGGAKRCDDDDDDECDDDEDDDGDDKSSGMLGGGAVDPIFVLLGVGALLLRRRSAHSDR